MIYNLLLVVIVVNNCCDNTIQIPLMIYNLLLVVFLLIPCISLLKKCFLGVLGYSIKTQKLISIKENSRTLLF
ncbi:unnamed protein product [Musa acuminata subsp. malaccensis]|uniref:(wild Malaysian banana) hypothetical protein n=1 Tax=Musa acuminata subsp. malaccensis TaxID=214687 RepID=A0A804I6V6_MUSAM|nr:unnamed protein product [Musa acuminata subsp. malaccensis]